MTLSQSDALVFFGATGDLAYKKIFPSLQALVKHGHLDVPVIGVAKAGWNLDQLKARRATASKIMAASIRPRWKSCADCCVMWTATTTTPQHFEPFVRSLAMRRARPTTWPFRP